MHMRLRDGFCIFGEMYIAGSISIAQRDFELGRDDTRVHTHTHANTQTLALESEI